MKLVFKFDLDNLRHRIAIYIVVGVLWAMFSISVPFIFKFYDIFYPRYSFNDGADVTIYLSTPFSLLTLPMYLFVLFLYLLQHTTWSLGHFFYGIFIAPIIGILLVFGIGELIYYLKRR
jgi:hypothetical protein